MYNKDNDCDDLVDDADASLDTSTGSTWYADSDNDGYGDNASTTLPYQAQQLCADNTDCNDSDTNINPDTIWYADVDADGFGNPLSTTSSCTQPANYVANQNDCDDTDGDISPNTTWYQDLDNDGYGNKDVTTNNCEKPAGYVSNQADCDDSDTDLNPQRHGISMATATVLAAPPVSTNVRRPKAMFVTKAIATTQMVPSTPTQWFADSDGDGYGDKNVTCRRIQPANYALNNTDCNDSNDSINPETTWYLDSDDDTFGTDDTTTQACEQPPGYAAVGGDCNDASAIYNPSTICTRLRCDLYGNNAIALTQSVTRQF